MASLADSSVQYFAFSHSYCTVGRGLSVWVHLEALCTSCVPRTCSPAILLLQPVSVTTSPWPFHHLGLTTTWQPNSFYTPTQQPWVSCVLRGCFLLLCDCGPALAWTTQQTSPPPRVLQPCPLQRGVNSSLQEGAPLSRLYFLGYSPSALGCPFTLSLHLY